MVNISVFQLPLLGFRSTIGTAIIRAHHNIRRTTKLPNCYFLFRFNLIFGCFIHLASSSKLLQVLREILRILAQILRRFALVQSVLRATSENIFLVVISTGPNSETLPLHFLLLFSVEPMLNQQRHPIEVVHVPKVQPAELLLKLEHLLIVLILIALAFDHNWLGVVPPVWNVTHH